jgi:hypothetical protein
MSLSQILSNPGISRLALLLACGVWVLKDEKDKSRQFLFLAMVLNVFYEGLFDAFMVRANSVLHWKYDYYLLCVDRALGVSADGVALAFRGPWSAILNVVYKITLPMMILWLVVNRKGNIVVVVRAYIAEMLVGPLLYGLLPGCGPAYAFGKAWTHPPLVQPELIRLDGIPMNAFPSLHIATALLFVLTAKNRLFKGLSLAFLAGTALATLTTGEHYVIDLVAGAAFGCFIASAGNLRLRRAVAYLGVTIAWSLAIRFGVYTLIAHPGVVRLFAALTMAVAMYAVWREWSGEGSEVRDSEKIRREEDVSLPAMPSA